MELLVTLLALVVLGVAVYFWWRSRRAAQAVADEKPGPKTVANLEPGDALSFWDGQNRLVETVLKCAEQVGGRTSQWQWIILDDGRLLEIAPEGEIIYGPPEIIHQGSADFEQLAAHGGVLKSFEQRVRDGVSGSEPTHFRHGRSSYRVMSTGTFTASPEGKVPTQQVLSDIGPQAGDNVYFEMESSSGSTVLGIWTSHIAWYVGEPLKESDVVSIFQKGKE